MNEREFQSEVARCLEPNRHPLVEVLRQVQGQRLPSDVARLCFEVFVDCFTSDFPVHLYYVDASETDPDFEGSVDPELIDCESVYPDELEEQLVAESPKSQPDLLAAETFIPWFGECWVEAGGREFSTPAVIRVHDDISEYDLAAGEWTDRR